jgi:exonuclease III
MKRWLALSLFAALAWAAPITLYDQLAPALSKVKTLQASNPSGAFDVLAGAESTFREGAGDLPPALRDGVLGALGEAKQALSRKSKADLEVRITLIKGIMGKALYDGYFANLGNSEASAYLSRMLRASNLPSALESKASSLVIAGDLEGLRTLLERAYATQMLAALQQATTQSSPAAAYQAMVKAYALYLVIQDSPRVQNLSAKGFYTALEKLAKSNPKGFRRDAQALTVQAKAVVGRLNPAKSAQASKAAPVKATAKPAVKATAKPAVKATAKPAVKATAKPAVKVAKPNPAPQNSVMEAKLVGSNPKAISEVRIVTDEAAIPAVQPPVAAAGYDKLVADLGQMLGNSQAAAQVANQVQAAGIGSMDEWKRAFLEIKGVLIEAQVQAEVGNTEAMRTLLGQVGQRYDAEIAPVVGVVRPELVERTRKLLNSAHDAVGLRTSDFSVLAGELQENRLATEGRTLGAAHSAAVTVLQAIMGIPRAFLFILVGLLSVFPLYLLSLTFGGRNRYWQMLGVSFFFLLLPVMFEGLSYFGAVLSDSRFGGLSFLSSLNAFSIQQNIFAQMFWAVSVFLVIVFAAIGLRGIATQFGLLQNRRAPAAETLSTTATGTTTGVVMATSEVEANSKPLAVAQPAGAPTLTMETIVDWDEEF